jgi:Arylsulfotransferase (ASST)
MCLAVVLAFAAGAPAIGKTRRRPPAKHTAADVVYTFPISGSRVASPETQIAFRGISAPGLGTIKVTGSASGVHTGTVEGDSDGEGASFIPATPFAPGETVTVTTSLPIAGGSGGTFTFQVAQSAPPVPPERRPAAPRVRGDVWHFASEPALQPAAVQITKPGPWAPGDIFLAPQIGPVVQGPEIIDPGGNLVWFDPLPPNDAATDFRVQHYQRQPVLTWWQGNETAGVGVGEDIIANSSYQVVKVISAANGLSADLHEFQLTPWGTALITAEYPVYWNASAVGGSRHEIVLDSVVQEIEIATGLVEFQWDSLDHVPLAASYLRAPKKQYGPANPYDYFHVNSVQLDRDGTLIISGRNTWSAYKVSRQTGAIIWTLGGKHSSFKMQAGAAFAFQHDVRVQAAGDALVTVFDDGAGPPYVHSQSRAIELALDVKTRTAKVVHQLEHDPRLLSSYEGDEQELPNGDDFIGWGEQPYFSEYTAKGKLDFEGRFVDDNISYRAYRFPWSGTPTTPPAVAASRRGAKMTVFASWNGATDVASWRVLAGSSAARLGAVASARKRGFETAIKAKAKPYVAVQALAAGGHVLATSPAAAVH